MGSASALFKSVNASLRLMETVAGNHLAMKGGLQDIPFSLGIEIVFPVTMRFL